MGMLATLRLSVWFNRYRIFVLFVLIGFALFGWKIVPAPRRSSIAETFPPRPAFNVQQLEMCNQGPLQVRKDMKCNDPTCGKCMGSIGRSSEWEISSNQLKAFAEEFNHKETVERKSMHSFLF